MPNKTTIIGQAIVNTTLYTGLMKQNTVLNQQNEEIDRMKAQARRAASSRPTGSSDEVDSLNAQIKRLKEEARINDKVLGQFSAAVAEKDAMITEWMHSNEAFKRLARQYGKKLGMADEQRLNDLNNTLVDVAEEDPKFANTKIGGEARSDLKAKPK